MSVLSACASTSVSVAVLNQSEQLFTQIDFPGPSHLVKLVLARGGQARLLPLLPAPTQAACKKPVLAVLSTWPLWLAPR